MYGAAEVKLKHPLVIYLCVSREAEISFRQVSSTCLVQSLFIATQKVFPVQKVLAKFSCFSPNLGVSQKLISFNMLHLL